MILIYNVLLSIGIVIGLPFIIIIVLASPKRRKTFLPRVGLKPLPESIRQKRLPGPEQKPIWIHALSVGEVISAVPLVKRLKDRFRNKNIVFSVSTKTGFEIANKLLKEKVEGIFFFPYDIVFSIKHLAGEINPILVVIVETDIWPNFLLQMKKRNIPVILVNARMSNKSFAGYRQLLFFTKSLFLCFSKICAQTGEDAQRFRLLGISPERILVTGNLKFDQEFDPGPEEEIEELKHSLNLSPLPKILLAGSTHKGEEIILRDAFSQIVREFSDLILIVAPRDPKRARAVGRIFESAGFSTVLMHELETRKPPKEVNVIVVDTIGILMKLYALADIAFVGGSLVDGGGHNPLEPAAFSKPILFGPDMSDFAEIAHVLIESGGATRVQDATSLYEATAMLVKDKKKAVKMGKCAFDVFSANKGAVGRILDVIEKSL